MGGLWENTKVLSTTRWKRGVCATICVFLLRSLPKHPHHLIIIIISIITVIITTIIIIVIISNVVCAPRFVCFSYEGPPRDRRRTIKWNPCG